MFTGLVEGLGNLVAVVPQGSAVDLTLQPAQGFPVPEDVAIGDSIAINGCCLTVTGIENGQWTFQAGSETLSRTNLGQLTPSTIVNLERSLRPSDRLGGHFVQGHVDGLGCVDKILHDGPWITMWFVVPAPLTKQMVVKGSVTVDGVSLTLVEVEETRFSVALIPHTLQNTTLGIRQPGDFVNVETDIIGKYMEKMLAGTPGVPTAVQP